MIQIITDIDAIYFGEKLKSNPNRLNILFEQYYLNGEYKNIIITDIRRYATNPPGQSLASNVYDALMSDMVHLDFLLTTYIERNKDNNKIKI